jgi:hypothetical protein
MKRELLDVTHCAVMGRSGTYVQSICGDYMNDLTFYHLPSEFIKQHPTFRYCQKCVDHEDLPLLLLGAV